MPAFGSNPTIEAVSLADGASVTLGAKADAAVVNPASDATLIALTKGNLTELLALVAKDYATQTTLAALLTLLNTITAGAYITRRSKELGFVLNYTGLAAGATLAGSWNTGCEWARGARIHSSCTMSYDLNINTQDAGATAPDWGATILSNVATTTSATIFRQTTMVEGSTTGASMGQFGSQIKFSVVNRGASPADGKVFVTLFA